jgi:HD-GYP domain-containing protein (c-di-GMP phosphodiesterase class II)
MDTSTPQKILLATGDTDWGLDTRVKLSSFGFECQLVREGKECQLSVYKEKFSTVLLDPDLKNHSGIEVLKFLKLTQPALKIVLVFPDKKRSIEYSELQNNLSRVGVSKSFIRPFNIKHMVDYLNELSPAQMWKHVTFQDGAHPEELDLKVLDKDCTRVDILSFMSGNLAIFDYYIRLKENHFVKIVKRGENIDPARVIKYSRDGVKHLYFLTKDRRTYINYMNELMKASLGSPEQNNKVILSQIKNVSEKFMEEIHSRGLKPDLVEESKALSGNMYQYVRKIDSLKEVMDQFEKAYPAKHAHSFLVAFFSCVICKNLSWVGTRTLESITLGAFLHDIGLLKLPEALRDRNPSTLNKDEFAKYQEHCRIGADLLNSIPEISQQVVQIVNQHHERINGTGYPNGLNGLRIYPLAKIVALADDFCDLIVERQISPLEGITIFLQDRERLIGFDPILIRALVTSFIKEDPKP